MIRSSDVAHLNALPQPSAVSDITRSSYRVLSMSGTGYHTNLAAAERDDELVKVGTPDDARRLAVAADVNVILTPPCIFH